MFPCTFLGTSAALRPTSKPCFLVATREEQDAENRRGVKVLHGGNLMEWASGTAGVILRSCLHCNLQHDRTSSDTATDSKHMASNPHKAPSRNGDHLQKRGTSAQLPCILKKKFQQKLHTTSVQAFYWVSECRLEAHVHTQARAHARPHFMLSSPTIHLWMR